MQNRGTQRRRQRQASSGERKWETWEGRFDDDAAESRNRGTESEEYHTTNRSDNDMYAERKRGEAVAWVARRRGQDPTGKIAHIQAARHDVMLRLSLTQAKHCRSPPLRPQLACPQAQAGRDAPDDS